mgnify:CR=1 FL=1
MTIDFDDFLNKELQNEEKQKEWLKQTILEYTQDGDYSEFFRALEQVIKARTTVNQFANKVGMNRVQLIDILHGKTKAPSIITINKILSGLGYKLSLEKIGT